MVEAMNVCGARKKKGSGVWGRPLARKGGWEHKGEKRWHIRKGKRRERSLGKAYLGDQGGGGKKRGEAGFITSAEKKNLKEGGRGGRNVGEFCQVISVMDAIIALVWGSVGG